MSYYNRWIVTRDQTLIDRQLAHRWLQTTYWGDGLPFHVFDDACDASETVAAFDTFDGQMIGFARMVTDGQTVGYICDVFVTALQRHRGVATMMLRELLSKTKSFRTVLLLTRDAARVYEQLGFERDADALSIYRPDVWKGSEQVETHRETAEAVKLSESHPCAGDER